MLSSQEPETGNIYNIYRANQRSVYLKLVLKNQAIKNFEVNWTAEIKLYILFSWIFAIKKDIIAQYFCKIEIQGLCLTNEAIFSTSWTKQNLILLKL